MSWDQRFVDPIILESLKPLVTLRAKSALNKKQRRPLRHIQTRVAKGHRSCVRGPAKRGLASSPFDARAFAGADEIG
jgi:hypothetical protein